MNERVEGLSKKLQDTHDEINSLRERIKEGEESLGKKFDDFVFCSVGTNSISWKSFYELDNQVRDSRGKEIAIVRYHREPIKYIDSFNDTSKMVLPIKMTFSTQFHLDYGVLTGEGIDFDLGKEQIIFPSEQSRIEASFNNVFDSSLGVPFNINNLKIEKKQEKIRRKLVDLPHLIKGLGPEAFFLNLSNSFSEILIGSKVKDYLKPKCSRTEIYSQIKNRL
ncbi:MAG: hypothetical protein ABIH79_02695 [archaeon]